MATQGKIRQSLYDHLGVDPGATDDEIRRAYKTLARKYHPDLNQGNAQAEMMFKAVGRAYEVLVDASKRAAYDDQIQREDDASRPSAPPKRRADVVLVFFGIMLVLAMIFFFVDTPKGIYFLVVAVALEIRTSIESLRAELRRNGK